MANVATVPCQYKTGRTLGQGTYAVVKEAQHVKTGEYYAVKVINKKLMEGREHMVRNEIAVLKRISQGHRNILTLVDYFETYNNLYLVTDYAKGGELFDRICAKMYYNERDAAHIIKSVTEAVSYLHDNDIVHRDLKPENLLFRTTDEDSDLLIADFGLSRIIDSEKFHILTTTCGTPGYMAPEIFKKSGHGKPVDMWAIGVITFFLLCGYTPFDHESSKDEMHAILRGDYKFEPVEHWAGITDTGKDFIVRLLTVDPDARMTSHEALNHSWLNDHLPSPMDGPNPDLLNSVRHNFNARRTFKKAVDAVKVINNLTHSRNVSLADLLETSRKEADENVDHVLYVQQTLNIPFPSSQLANIAEKVLKVDKELKTEQVERIITVEEEVNLIILRISVNSILDMIIMIIKTMDAFDETE
ncbi:1986_t:CDS:10 [Diversispora eburnea]|uniref:1986_t:CDS:1 n=1 Tax=Diversispora eburnea TaxID=1213867 RepID=A0A9N8WLN4_9GLOM|nr:1986_t:CDS:10 [Diversispora eburnea]